MPDMGSMAIGHLSDDDGSKAVRPRIAKLIALQALVLRVSSLSQG